MTPPLRAVQSVDGLLAHPERVATLDPGEAQRLSIQLSALLVALTLRASEPQITRDQENKETVQWMSSEEVTQQFGLDRAWLHEHRRLLQSLGVVSRVSRKTVLFDPRKLRRFIESRRATNKDVAS